MPKLTEEQKKALRGLAEGKPLDQAPAIQLTKDLIVYLSRLDTTLEGRDFKDLLASARKAESLKSAYPEFWPLWEKVVTFCRALDDLIEPGIEDMLDSMVGALATMRGGDKS
jgi:hypothetical protein